MASQKESNRIKQEVSGGEETPEDGTRQPDSCGAEKPNDTHGNWFLRGGDGRNARQRWIFIYDRQRPCGWTQGRSLYGKPASPTAAGLENRRFSDMLFV